MAQSQSTPKKDRFAEAIGDALGAVSNAAARRPWAVLGVVALITSGLGAGLLQVEFKENLLEILPEDHPYTRANLNLSEDFPGHHSYVNVNFAIAPEKWDEANQRLPNRVPPQNLQRDGDDPTQVSKFVGRTNVSDEVYLRGLEEFYRDWMRNPKYLPPDVDVFNVAWNAHVKLINYTNSANPANCAPDASTPNCFDPAAYKFPGTDPQGEAQFATNWATVYQAAPDETSTQASPEWDVTRSVFVYVPLNGTQPDYNAIGLFAKQAFLDYVQAAKDGELEWDVFDLERSGPTDAKIMDDAHGTELAKEDLTLLAPLVAAFILVALFLAFRSPKAILVATSSLLIGTVWTYGLMGYMRIPLNTLNLTVVPLILGVGIDYSIHMTREYLEHKSHGLSDAESFREAGRRSGFAMLIATVTTVVGLGIMAYSPSPLIADMGVLSAIALVFIFVLAMVFIPAALVVSRITIAQGSYTPSALMPRLGRAVSSRRGAVVVLLVVLTAGFYANWQHLTYEAFGNPALNFPEGDQVRDWYDEGQAAFFSTSDRAWESNWVIIEGDITTPEAHRYIKALQEELRANPDIRDDSVTSIWNLVLQWEQLKRGTPAAVGVIGLGALHDGTQRPEFDPYPQTQQDIRTSLDEMYACPCFDTYASLFINRDYDMTVILIDTRTGGTYAGAKTIIDSVEETLADPEIVALAEAANVQTSLGGYTTFSVLFIEGEMPWVTYMAYASMGLVVLIVLVVWRDVKAALAIGALVSLTTVWWLGTLPMMGIGLAVTLTLPLVFINCIGSDYGVHLIWAAKQDGSMRRVLENTGKAVLFSVVTTVGAFALFIPMTNLMMRRSMLATTVAILMIFAVTVLLVPILYRVKSAAEEEGVRTVPVEAVGAEDEPEEDIVVFAKSTTRR